MNPRGWTIYDDDTRDFEQELNNEGDLNGLSLNELLKMSIRSSGKEPKEVDHFEQESDLFEV